MSASSPLVSLIRGMLLKFEDELKLLIKIGYILKEIQILHGSQLYKVLALNP